MVLCLERTDSGNNEFNHFVALPEPVSSIEVAVTTGQQIIVAGTNQNGIAFLQGVDYTGNLLWRYPSLAQINNDYLQFYDLALSKNKTILFAAGSANEQSMLWHFSLDDSGISHIQEIFATGNSVVSGSYRQVITHSGNEAIVVHQPEQNELPARLEKWHRQDDQWLHIPDFCPQLSLSNVDSTALKTEQPGKRFFFIASQPEQIHFFQIDMLAGNLLNQLVADSLLHWDYTVRVTTPALLSASTALKQESTNQPSLFQKQITDLNHDLVNRSALTLVNRGCLLGLSSSSTQTVTLVINLCSIREDQESKVRSSITEETNLSGVALNVGFIIKSTLMASGILGLSVFCMKGFQMLHSAFIRRLSESLPEESRKDELRRKRLERFTVKPLCESEGSNRFHAPSGELLLQDIPLKKIQALPNAEQEKYLELLLLAVKAESAETKVIRKNIVTQRMLSEALAKVRIRKDDNAANSEHNRMPDALALRSTPADNFCFYHAIGQAINVSGPELLNTIVHQAQKLLQNAPALSETVNDAGGSEILAEIAAMGHVDEAGLQIWGHQEMLPFICSILDLPVVVVTPAA